MEISEQILLQSGREFRDRCPKEKFSSTKGTVQYAATTSPHFKLFSDKLSFSMPRKTTLTRDVITPYFTNT